MDWITGIQKALDYTEEHLMDEIDYEMIAKQAYSSVFHFQRIFGMMCGFSLGDYIRMRRLTLAARDLMKTNHKIIDIALKYGYDNPESFTRAFTRFHGISPTEAKHGGNVKSFSRLSVKLILSGGNTMEYRIEKKEAFKIVCCKKNVKKEQGETATKDISKYWKECAMNGSIKKLCSYMPNNPTMAGLLGVCFSGEMANSGFPYGIGVEYDGRKIDENFEIVSIPEYTFAVFQCKGKMPEAFVETYRKICTEFFPQSQYEYGAGVELEVYPSDDVSDPNYSCEIWIAVKEK